jgi:hypothetical protein
MRPSLKRVFRFVAILAHVGPTPVFVEFEAKLFCHLQHDLAPQHVSALKGQVSFGSSGEFAFMSD